MEGRSERRWGGSPQHLGLGVNCKDFGFFVLEQNKELFLGSGQSGMGPPGLWRTVGLLRGGPALGWTRRPVQHPWQEMMVTLGSRGLWVDPKGKVSRIGWWAGVGSRRRRPSPTLQCYRSLGPWKDGSRSRWRSLRVEQVCGRRGCGLGRVELGLLPC